MIGGYDLVYDSQVCPAESKKIITELAKALWVDCFIEDDEDVANEFDCFYYKNKGYSDLWGDLGADPKTENTMIYFLAGNYGNQITLVVCSIDHPDMKKFIEGVSSATLDGYEGPIFTENKS